MLHYVRYKINHCLGSSAFPSSWKQLVIKVKTETASKLTDRPVLSKVFEKIIILSVKKSLNSISRFRDSYTQILNHWLSVDVNYLLLYNVCHIFRIILKLLSIVINKLLLSIGQLFDTGCKTLQFTYRKMLVTTLLIISCFKFFSYLNFFPI